LTRSEFFDDSNDVFTYDEPTLLTLLALGSLQHFFAEKEIDVNPYFPDKVVQINWILLDKGLAA